jgi:cytochrome b
MAEQTMSQQRIKLWDLPTRIFHWSLAVLVVFAVITGQIGGGAIDWHGKIGLAILGLLSFRIVWGVLGSTYARFTSFFPTPAMLTAYRKGQWHGVGHNPLGAFSVFGLLGLLAFQVATGLLSNDDIAFNGPLSGLIGKDLSDRLSGLHEFTSNLLMALVALHVGAIAFYVRVKKDNLVKPMITGWKDVQSAQGGSAESATGGGIIAFVLALLIALVAVYGGSGAWIPVHPLPPASVQPAPAW